MNIVLEFPDLRKLYPRVSNAQEVIIWPIVV